MAGLALRQFNTKLTDEDIARLERARERLQQRVGPNYRVTHRTVILEALERLEGYLDRLDRDKERAR